ncbi:tight adherence protein B [Actinopolyspora mzabensis]|uniref:Tight adherence protein B n=1 Tax=Actinopolyspora mzabensis TaxID=995066 RepID=A0A1G9AXB1_ACTMZ|nr:secretion system protein [Actinopolyspora mzabensis]SDK31971.1 tight adherence protein B [Actinopolyspora mzabensis]
MLTSPPVQGTPAVPMSVVLASAALLLGWPDRAAVNRLALLRGPVGSASRSWPRPILPVLGLGGVVLLVSAVDLTVILVLVLLAALAERHRRWRARSAHRLRVLEALVAGLRVLVSELEVGTHPYAAAESAAAESAAAESGAAESGAADSTTEVSGFFTDLANSVRLGGLPDREFGSGPLSAELHRDTARIARRWRLAERYGVPLARLLETAQTDLEHRLRAERDVEAKLAGARATAAVLLALPALGLALGQASGAGALAVLTTTPLGHVLLLSGTGLLCGGVLWVQRLTDRGARQ